MKRFLTSMIVIAAIVFAAPMCTPEQSEPDDKTEQNKPEEKPGPEEPGPDQPGPEEPGPVEPEPEDGTGTVLVVGGGASGVAAALQCARMGIEVTIVEECPWLGGMLTSAGVSAIDGNYDLKGGIFKEFTDQIASYYGGYGSIKTGWVSNILYSPERGEKILEEMCSRETRITIVRGQYMTSLSKKSRGWTVTCQDQDGGQHTYDCDILIDGTELGDVAKAAGVKYRVGMDSPTITGERRAIGPNDIVQDLTMVMTVKKYDHDVSIPEPDFYNRDLYVNCCKNRLNVPMTSGQTLWDQDKMMTYGLLPNGEVMLNWPIYGNDYYVNMIEMTREQREEAVYRAKQHALGYLYFIQHELGETHWGLADDQYPSEDLFPFIPYHRESRRIVGEYLFTVDEAESPLTYKKPGYRSGIAVGNYPVDHHHYAYADWNSIKIDFPKIVPFTIPMGCLIPLEVEDLIVAEKSIGVSNIINGSTRLQPVTLELGQAAGALASLAIKQKKSVREVSIRRVQGVLVDAGALIEPYMDATSDIMNSAAMQRIGSTGIMRADYAASGWSNTCYFRPGDHIRWCDLHLEDYYGIEYNPSTEEVTVAELESLIESITGEKPETGYKPERVLMRHQVAALLDKHLDPFNSVQLNFDGTLKR